MVFISRVVSSTLHQTMARLRVGIFGGSGFYEMDGFKQTDKVTLTTPFGDPSDSYIIGTMGDIEMVFLPRHGVGHRYNPSEVNYRANVWGMKVRRDPPDLPVPCTARSPLPAANPAAPVTARCRPPPPPPPPLPPPPPRRWPIETRRVVDCRRQRRGLLARGGRPGRHGPHRFLH